MLSLGTRGAYPSDLIRDLVYNTILPSLLVVALDVLKVSVLYPLVFVSLFLLMANHVFRSSC